MQPIKATGQTKLRGVFYQGFLINLLNPHTLFFFFALPPQFVEPSQGSIALQLLLIGVLLTVVSFPIYISVGLAGGHFGAWLRTRGSVHHATKWVTGLIYIALGITIAG